jgi:predicted DsbA family dithiol-disulfide isomerase
MTELRIDVVSDVVCPWCFIGKRQLDKALEAWRVEHPEFKASVRWHPYFLNPDTPETGEPYRPFLEKKFGGPEKLAAIWSRVSDAGRNAGIDFAFEKIELRANTLNAHRLIHHAQKVGAGGTVNDALIEHLFIAQFIDGRNVGDRTVLTDIAGESGMDRLEVERYLASDEDVAEVRANAEEAQRMGISGVPFFIFNRKISASGAQPPEGLLSAMRQAIQAT